MKAVNGVTNEERGAKVSKEEMIKRRKEAVGSISKEMIAVMKEYDSTPSVLSYPLSTLSKTSSGIGATGSPPSKRKKLSESIPDTIEGRLQGRTYVSLSALMQDVAVVCQAIKAEAITQRGPDSITDSIPSTDVTIARIVCFERMVKDLITRQRKREADSLDFVEELIHEEEADDKDESGNSSGKVALTVMGQYGPLFSSLQKPQQLGLPRASATSSDASSTATSPRSATSAATSVPDGPAKDVEEVEVEVPFLGTSLPPLVSTVDAMPANADKGKSTSKDIKSLTIGESFPPPSTALPLVPMKFDKPTIGVKWGGEIGIGGINSNASIDVKSEPASHWLMYTNIPRPGTSRVGVDPFRKGIGLDSHFVATFSSFAPTRDESLAKVPASVTNNIWWVRRGEKVFRKLFEDDPALKNMFPERQEAKTTTVVVGKGNPTPIKEIVEIDEKELEAAIAEIDGEIPIDEALLNLDINQQVPTDPASAVLTEISSLLGTLQSQQYARFASGLPTAPPPTTPTDPELETYRTLTMRLSHLISTLPPHIIATIDGNPDSALNLSKLLPLSEGSAIYNGTLPTDDTSKIQPPATIRDAAMNAMNAAAGMSPVSATAPVAPMLQPPRQSTPMRPQSHSPVPQYHQTYPVQQGYASPVAPQATMGYHSPLPPAPRIPTPGTPQQHQVYHHSPVTPAAQHLPPGPGYGYSPAPPVPQQVTTPQHYPQQPQMGYPVNPDQQRAIQLQQQQLAQAQVVLQQQQQQQAMMMQQQPRPAYVPPAPQGYATPRPQPPMGGPVGYSTPQAYPPQPQMPQTVPPRPRGNVPPPQGLAAVGVGGMGQAGYTNTPGRYSTRKR
ncbi:hypothetical protein EX30DRAFT_338274 [Ascodesmis nigricans]|uniref:Uncharacterized protein n=1 Tax=Ascodesmis nigricans TaxID=341454 RepID=A0A4S2N3A8_9PEZI|nr:hypothetical protein EX30DRAFT_338274 [Ascodesmis nigricans]